MGEITIWPAVPVGLPRVPAEQPALRVDLELTVERPVESARSPEVPVTPRQTRQPAVPVELLPLLVELVVRTPEAPRVQPEVLAGLRALLARSVARPTRPGPTPAVPEERSPSRAERAVMPARAQVTVEQAEMSC